MMCSLIGGKSHRRTDLAWLFFRYGRSSSFEGHADPGIQCLCDAAEVGEGMAFVAGRFEAADLLLRGVEPLCEFLGFSVKKPCQGLRRGLLSFCDSLCCDR